MARKSRKEKQGQFGNQEREAQALRCSRRVFRTAFYLRLSEKEQARGVSGSIQNQESLLYEYIEDKPEFQLAGIYVDDGESGTNFNRPGFCRMFADIKKKQVDCVMVKDLSRLGRNFLETGKVLEVVFPFFGVRFVSVTEGFDSQKEKNGDLGFLLPLKNLMNESYVRDIAEKERSAKRAVMKKGGFAGGAAPYGYRKEEGETHHLLVDWEAANVVRQMAFLSEQGMGDGKIAAWLNQRKVPSPSVYRARKTGAEGKGHDPAGVWYKQAVRRILTDPVYTGRLVQGKRERLFPKGRRIQRSEEEWIVSVGTHEAIISEEQFARLAAGRAARRERHGAEGKERPGWSAAGLLVCAGCKKAMTRHRAAGGRYACTTAEAGGACRYVSVSERAVAEVFWVQGKVLALCGQETKDQKMALEEGGTGSAERTGKPGCAAVQSILYEKFLNGAISREAYLKKRGQAKETLARFPKIQAEELQTACFSGGGQFFPGQGEGSRKRQSQLFVERVFVVDHRRLVMQLVYKDPFLELAKGMEL